MVEIYASIIAKKMLTSSDPGYVDLASPASIGIGTLVYNYDGDVYGAMRAECWPRRAAAPSGSATCATRPPRT